MQMAKLWKEHFPEVSNWLCCHLQSGKGWWCLLTALLVFHFRFLLLLTHNNFLSSHFSFQENYFLSRKRDPLDYSAVQHYEFFVVYFRLLLDSSSWQSFVNSLLKVFESQNVISLTVWGVRFFLVLLIFSFSSPCLPFLARAAWQMHIRLTAC